MSSRNPIRTGTLDIHLGCDVTVSIPVCWINKHYDMDATRTAVEEFVQRLGYSAYDSYLNEDEE